MRAPIGSGVFGLVCAVALGQQPVPEDRMVFEVASIKPHATAGPTFTGRTGIQEDAGQIRIENLSLSTLISISFDLKGRGQLVGPGWLSDVTFDIVAKPPAGYKREQLQYLLRNLLSDRFRLSVHKEIRPLSAFALVVAKSGPRLQESSKPRTYHTARPGLIEGNQWSMTELAAVLARFMGTSVADETGLNALYDLKLEWTPDVPAEPPNVADAAVELAGPSLFTALQEKLGLRVESRKVAAEVVVVDHIERTPTGN
jgi:uncharacterized protein (TIGR03435 family)